MKKIPIRFINSHRPITIAIIGFGSFGKLLTNIFLDHSDARIIVVSSKTHTTKNKRLSFVHISDISKADIVIPCVPISEFERTIKIIVPHVKREGIVMDICSVMDTPANIMKRHLPNTVQIIASHPMFGPDSFKINKGLNGLRMVIHNISSQKKLFETLSSFFKTLGVHVIHMTPKEHDKHMAMSLGYSYLIGKIGQRMSITKTPIDTVDFEMLLTHTRIIQNDSEQLFFDMQTQNAFAPTMHRKVQRTLDQICNEIAVRNQYIKQGGKHVT